MTIAGQIKSVGSFKLPPNWDGWVKLTGFADEKGPSDMNAPDGLSGQVRKRHGIVPLLFLMALRDAKLEGVNIGLAGDDGLAFLDHRVNRAVQTLDEILSRVPKTGPLEGAYLQEVFALALLLCYSNSRA